LANKYHATANLVKFISHAGILSPNKPASYSHLIKQYTNEPTNWNQTHS